MSAHTPGPWKIFICDDGGQWSGWPLSINAANVTNDNGDPRTVVRTGGQYPYEWDHGTSRDEAVANARLIAAAPDLLEALKAARHTIRTEVGVIPVLAMVDKAIAKAVSQKCIPEALRTLKEKP